MRRTLEITRRKEPEDEPYLQSFVFETDDEQATVASALRDLDARVDLRDSTGVPAQPVRWECGCLQRKCGACAMLIDGVPRLACDVPLATTANVVHLAALRTFPPVADLVVNRQVLFDRLRDLGVWLEHETQLAVRHHESAYEATRCLQCGICLEVCPNFFHTGNFGGMAAMSPEAHLLSVASKKERKRLARIYRESVHGGCGKSLACRDVCPIGMDIDYLMSRSTAASVWHRW